MDQFEKPQLTTHDHSEQAEARENIQAVFARVRSKPFGWKPETLEGQEAWANDVDRVFTELNGTPEFTTWFAELQSRMRDEDPEYEQGMEGRRNEILDWLDTQR